MYVSPLSPIWVWLFGQFRWKAQGWSRGQTSKRRRYSSTDY